MRASRSSVATMASLFAVPLIIWLLAASKQASMWVPVLFCFSGLVILLFWITAFNIEVDHSVLKYSTLFGGTNSIKLGDIQSAHFEVGYACYRDRFKPPIRLVIRSRDGKKLTLNLKVFQAAEVEKLLSFLNAPELGWVKNG